MTHGQGYGPQDQPWQLSYDPREHGQPFQRPPQGQPWQAPQEPWQQPGYNQQPPYPGQPQYAPGPPQPPRRKRHTARNILLSTGGLVVVIIVIAAAASGGHKANTANTVGAQSPSAAGSASQAAPSAPPVTGDAACKALAAWENSSSGSVTQSASLQKTFADTTQPLSGDFAAWIAAIKSTPSADSIAASQVASDCSGYGVTVFPPASPPAPASSAPASPSLAGHVVATFSGSGIENTATFTVTATWKLDYSFDCTNFGYQGNFQVYEYGGSSGLSSVMVNDLATGKTASTYAYGDAGTHYLEINSECSWTVKITDEGS